MSAADAIQSSIQCRQAHSTCLFYSPGGGTVWFTLCCTLCGCMSWSTYTLVIACSALLCCTHALPHISPGDGRKLTPAGTQFFMDSVCCACKVFDCVCCSFVSFIREESATHPVSLNCIACPLGRHSVVCCPLRACVHALLPICIALVPISPLAVLHAFIRDGPFPVALVTA